MMFQKQYTTKKIQSTISKAILVSGLIITLNACSSTSNMTGVEAQNRNHVEMVKIPYTLNFVANDEKLSKEEIGKLNYFLATSNIQYGDEFSMDFPLERDGSLSSLNTNRRNYISNLLKESGLYLSSKVTPFGMEPKKDSGRLIISKYVVTPPVCGNWSQEPHKNYNNAPISNFGCAAQANLGLMVANPRDLITGQNGSGPNAEKAAKAVETYQSTTISVAPVSTSGEGS